MDSPNRSRVLRGSEKRAFALKRVIVLIALARGKFNCQHKNDVYLCPKLTRLIDSLIVSKVS